MQSITHGKNLGKVTNLSAFMKVGPKTDYTPARKILGKDFISAYQIATACRILYTKNQLLTLDKKLPDQKTIEAIHDAGMMLVAGPPTAMSTLDIRALHADYFCSKGPEKNDPGWYDCTNSVQFASADKIEALIWIALSKEPVDGSLSKNWEEQRVLVAEPLDIPNAAEQTWGMACYVAVNKVYLPNKDIIVRTNSLDCDGRNRVCVGNSEGIAVHSLWNRTPDDSLGISACRRF